MKKISIEDRGAVAILRLTNGVTNAISPELVKDLLPVQKLLAIAAKFF